MADYIQKIRTIAGDKPICAANDLPPQRVSPSSKGWYRVASITTLTHSFSCKFDIAQTYSSSMPQTHNILITSSSSGGIKFTQLNGSGGSDLVIPKIRVVKEGAVYSIEYYYSVSVQNYISIRVYDIIIDNYAFAAVSMHEVSAAETGTEFVLSSTSVKATSFEGEFIGDVTGNATTANTAKAISMPKLASGEDLLIYAQGLAKGVHYVEVDIMNTSTPSGIIAGLVEISVESPGFVFTMRLYEPFLNEVYVASFISGRGDPLTWKRLGDATVEQILAEASNATNNTIITHGATDPTTETKGRLYLQEVAPEADYVVEQGISGLWTYRKWNSGIAECWGVVVVDCSKLTFEASGSNYFTGPVAFDLPFVITDRVEQLTSGMQRITGCTVYATSDTQPQKISFRLNLSRTTASTDAKIHVSVRGRWK